MKKIYRQGDVLLHPVSALPAGCQPVANDPDNAVVLARGKVTGHRHRLDGGVAELVRPASEMMGGGYVRLSQEAPLVHEEHDTITLPAGLYKLVIQREYDEAAVRQVAD